MGNMSNPLINRWGLNLFWYNFWYVDKHRHTQVNLDYLVRKLIHVYLNCGLLFKKNIFLNNYRYLSINSQQFDVNSLTSHHNLKYVRSLEHKNKITEKITVFYNRIKATKNLYTTKIWILKYHNFYIINFYSFQPLKKKGTSKKKINAYPFALKKNFMQTNHSLLLFRLKSVLTFSFLFFFTKTKNYYCF